MSTESSQWRKFLQPVVTGLVALMASATCSISSVQTANATAGTGFQNNVSGLVDQVR